MLQPCRPLRLLCVAAAPSILVTCVTNDDDPQYADDDSERATLYQVASDIERDGDTGGDNVCYIRDGESKAESHDLRATMRTIMTTHTQRSEP